MMKISETSLQQLITRVVSALRIISPTDSLHDAGTAALALFESHPEAAIALAHQKIHEFPFKHVPTCWRRLYEEGSLWQVSRLLSTARSEQLDRPDEMSEGDRLVVDDKWATLKEEIVRLLDMAIILTGAPERRELIDNILEELYDWRDKRVEKRPPRAPHENPHRPACVGDHINYLAWDRADDRVTVAERRDFDGAGMDEQQRRKRQKIAHNYKRQHRLYVERQWLREEVDMYPRAYRRAWIPLHFPHKSRYFEPRTQKTIPAHACPSLDMFEKLARDKAAPMIITQAIDHWPALMRWPCPRYWLLRSHRGRRLVPVELGSSYTDEGWGQKIMKFGDFLVDHLLDPHVWAIGDASSDAPPSEHIPSTPTPPIGYLAQHDLVSQIPALRKDIAIPDYCYIVSAPPTNTSPPPSSTNTPTATTPDESPPPTEPLLNIWLGPAGTVSPLHTDPHDNLLCQVMGRKYVRLYSPSQISKLYLMSSDDSGIDMGNTSRVDVGLALGWAAEHEELVRGSAAEEGDGKQTLQERRRRQGEEFPDFEAAEFVEGVLREGEMLFIPRGWWHFVRSLDVSASVSFWWD